MSVRGEKNQRRRRAGGSGRSGGTPLAHCQSTTAPPLCWLRQPRTLVRQRLMIWIFGLGVTRRATRMADRRAICSRGSRSRLVSRQRHLSVPALFRQPVMLCQLSTSRTQLLHDTGNKNTASKHGNRQQHGAPITSMLPSIASLDTIQAIFLDSALTCA